MGIGEDPTGSPTTVLYEDWINVVPGEDYYLMINNFSNNNSGFSIQFTGDIFITNPYDALDCSIINNLLGPPRAACDNEIVILDATVEGFETGIYLRKNFTSDNQPEQHAYVIIDPIFTDVLQEYGDG